MPKYFQFIAKLFAYTSILCVVVCLIAGNYKNTYYQATLLSFILSFLLFLIGFLIINWAFQRSLKQFMAVLFGGIFVRFLLIAGIIFLVMRLTDYDIKYFISVFAAFYLIYQFFEFRFFDKKLKKGSK